MALDIGKDSAIKLNDADGKTFKQIAALIQRYL